MLNETTGRPQLVATVFAGGGAAPVDAIVGRVYGWRAPPTSHAEMECASMDALTTFTVTSNATAVHVMEADEERPATLENRCDRAVIAAHFSVDGATQTPVASGFEAVLLPGGTATVDRVKAGDYVDWRDAATGAHRRRTVSEYPGHTGHVFEDTRVEAMCGAELSVPLRTLTYWDVVDPRGIRPPVEGGGPFEFLKDSPSPSNGMRFPFGFVGTGRFEGSS